MYQLNLQNTAVKITYDDLNNFSICEFSISFDNNINKWDKIKIYEWNDHIFTWYVVKDEPVLDRTNNIVNITCYDEKHYLSQIRLLNYVSVVWWNIGDIITEIQSQYNIHWQSWTGDVDNTPIAIQAGIWSSWFDVFNDLPIKWTVREWVIVAKQEIGQDISYTEKILYTPYESNVNGIKIETKSNFANVVIWKSSGWNTYIYPTTLPTLITGVDFQEFRDWDLQQSTIDYYNKLWNTNIIYRADVEQWSITANVWDIIGLVIKWFGKYDYNGRVYVTKKTVEYTNAVKIETYEVSESVYEKSDFVSKIRKLGRDVQRLQTS